MKTKIGLLALFFSLLAMKSFALQDIEVGLRLGVDLPTNVIGFYTDDGKYIPKRCDLDGRFNSINFAGAVVADFAFNDYIILGVAGHFSLFRSYSLAEKDIDGSEIGKTKVNFHTFALDIMMKGRMAFADDRYSLIAGIGLGPTLNTKPTYKQTINNQTERGSIDNGKLYVGLNLIAELGFSMQTVENQFIQFGVRTTLDVLAFTYNKGMPSASLNGQSAISPYNVGIFLGYSFRF
ncbi:hypothetical protein [Entomospira culicis]|uniref:Outer membrane protein beta-barrel domain-containing protein n=1 Tax=Entomospira culicis TaxID=2719989 RepID=A0A968KWF2_9SPIO|nr:hypothetical protein [Entomospira culicis]NIZ18927.1 hypothetical protein [Entomospira culicis]NIZ69142.1 hypothetical protein [Entomospira culicis]WDI37728.1 hypothetical protein PVA46_02790 [Entomospira culicis]WDI39356.1 hypothetical protein PVA47_02795 [Entomospira culicis]